MDLSGVATVHGPVSVNFVVPTAVTLAAVQASPAAVLPVSLAGTLLVLAASLTGALAVRRRRV